MTAVDHRRVEAQARAAQDDDDFWETLLPEAAELVITAGHASPAMLSRKMRVGAAMACDLLVELAELEVVGPAGDDRAREVLVGPDRLGEVLAWIAEQAGDDAGEEVVDEDPPAVTPVVSLVKPPADTSPDASDEDDDWWDDQPGGELVVRPDDDLELYQPGELVEHQRERQHLVTRTVQTARRGRHWASHQPTLVRGASITRQAPKAAGLLVVYTPRGAVRVLVRGREWLWATNAQQQVAQLLEDGQHEVWVKASATLAARLERLALRRWLIAGLLGLAGLVGLAWWAPGTFRWLLAGLVFAAILTAGWSTCRALKELAILVGAALALASVVWWQGLALAALIPQPPAWWAWAALAVLVVVCGLAGRQEDQPLMEMPMAQTDEATGPKKPSAEMVVDALCRLGITGMTPAVIEQVREETRVIAPGVGRSRRGWHLQLELPWAVTAGQVMDKREQLAAALKRELGTVWPTQGPRHPGHLVLFLADRPMATSPQEPWSVVDKGRVDIFSSLEMFTDQEGRWVELQIAYKRILIGGESGSGKSFYARQIGVACAFDPRVRIVVFDGKANGDMDPLIPVAHGFYIGAQPEEMAAQLAAAQAIEREMDRRARFLRTLPREENPENKVTSALVDRYPDLAPYLVIVDELQEYTQAEDKAMAKEFTRIFTRFSRLGRSAGIIPVIATQYPADGVVPVAMRSNFSTKFCLRVEGHQQVEVILGTGSYASGLKANLFTASESGLAWHKGDGQEPSIVRSVYGLDGPACDELVEQARAMRANLGMLTGQAADGEVVDAEIVISIVEDVESVMRHHQRGRAQWVQLVPWLRESRPGHYIDLTEDELSARIRSAGIEPRQVKVEGVNRNGVYLSDLRKRPDEEAG